MAQQEGNCLWTRVLGCCLVHTLEGNLPVLHKVAKPHDEHHKFDSCLALVGLETTCCEN